MLKYEGMTVRQTCDAISRLYGDELWDLCNEMGFVGEFQLKAAELRFDQARRLVSKLWAARSKLRAELESLREALKQSRDSRLLPAKGAAGPK